MHRAFLVVLGLFAFFGLTGCQAPGAVLPAAVAPAALERPVEATVSVGGYRLAGLADAYSARHIDHLRLSRGERCKEKRQGE